MKFNYEKASLFSAAMALVAATFIACGPDDSASVEPIPPEPQVSSSSIAPPPPMSSTTEVSPIRFTDFVAAPNVDKTLILFHGSATLDNWDTLANASAVDGLDPYFTNIELNLVYLVNGQPAESQLFFVMQDLPDFSGNNITALNLNELGAQVKDGNKIQCGSFRAYVTLYATNDPNKPDKFISRDSIDFDREEVYCAPEPEPVSSSSVPGVNVELVEDSITLTAKGIGFNFTTWQAVPAEEADIYLELVPGEEALNLHVGNGTTKIGEYTNADDKINFNDDWDYDVLNPRNFPPVTMSMFQFNQAKLGSQINALSSSKYYVALTANYNELTGDGFYAFTLAKQSTVDKSGNISIVLQVFKKK